MSSLEWVFWMAMFAFVCRVIRRSRLGASVLQKWFIGLFLLGVTAGAVLMDVLL